MVSSFRFLVFGFWFLVLEKKQFFCLYWIQFPFFCNGNLGLGNIKFVKNMDEHHPFLDIGWQGQKFAVFRVSAFIGLVKDEVAIA